MTFQDSHYKITKRMLLNYPIHIYIYIHVYMYIYIYIYICIYDLQLQNLVVAIESWPEWDLSPQT